MDLVVISANFPISSATTENPFPFSPALAASIDAFKESKPVSCHLYPIRVKDFTEFAAVNYDRWDICNDACSLGKELEVPVYKFVKEALIRRFGEDWYLELEKVAQELKK